LVVTTTPSACDVAAVSRDRAEYWGALADEQDRPWEYRPAGPGPWLVALPADEAAAAIDALVGNVFSHTPEGAAYRVSVEPDGAGVVVAVDDAGPGIADPALVVERGRSGAGSSGLGLDIARRAAETAGGRLEIGPGPLGGTRAALRLPLVGPKG
jgi:signal transduction histidine kinase